MTNPTTGELAGKTKSELNSMLKNPMSKSALSKQSKNDLLISVHAELSIDSMENIGGNQFASKEYKAELEKRIGEDDETAQMFMNIKTGTVDSRKHWFYENEDGEQVNAVDKGEVVPVFWGKETETWSEEKASEGETVEKKKREKLDYASVFTKIVSNIKSEVFNIDPCNVRSCYLSVKSGLKGTNYVICINNKVHRIELYTTLSENKPIFSYINRDVRKVNKDILFEAPADRKAMKMILEIPATDNIEEDAIDIASKADEFLKVIEPIVQKQIANIEISKNK